MSADLTLAEVAAIFRCEGRKIRETANRLSIGYNLKGRAGWRFTELDVDRLRKAMAPVPVTEKRRRA